LCEVHQEVYLYVAGGTVAEQPTPKDKKVICMLGATSDATRVVRLGGGATGMEAILFAGTKLNQPIAW
jgi:redox-sensitive bicupin YhaK (pirin superfamily)